LGSEAAVEEEIEFLLVAGLGLVVLFDGRLPHFEYHSFAAGLDELGGRQVDGLVVDVDGFAHGCSVSVRFTLNILVLNIHFVKSRSAVGYADFFC
jgi:hypothetical protein